MSGTGGDGIHIGATRGDPRRERRRQPVLRRLGRRGEPGRLGHPGRRRRHRERRRHHRHRRQRRRLGLRPHPGDGSVRTERPGAGHLDRRLRRQSPRHDRAGERAARPSPATRRRTCDDRAHGRRPHRGTRRHLDPHRRHRVSRLLAAVRPHLPDGRGRRGGARAGAGGAPGGAFPERAARRGPLPPARRSRSSARRRRTRASPMPIPVRCSSTCASPIAPRSSISWPRGTRTPTRSGARPCSARR